MNQDVSLLTALALAVIPSVLVYMLVCFIARKLGYTDIIRKLTESVKTQEENP